MADTPAAPVGSVFLVRSEHLNHAGHLFGGDLMAEIDTVGFCLIRRLFPERMFVTRAAEIEFEAPARLGDVIEFSAVLGRVGCTSVQVQVRGTAAGRALCQARMTYVRIDADGRKLPVEAP